MMSVLRARWLRRLIGVLLTGGIVLSGLGIVGPDPAGTVDRLLYDARLRHRTVTLDDHVVIIDFAGSSALAAVDRRRLQADLARVLERLFAQGRPAVVGLALPGLEIGPAVTGDPPIGTDHPSAVTGYPLDTRFAARIAQAPDAPVTTTAVAGVPTSGFLNLLSAATREPDGILRAMPLFARAGAAAVSGADGGDGSGPGSFDGVDETVGEAFALAVLRRYLGNGLARFEPPATAQPAALVLSGERGRIDIPLSRSYTALVPLAGAGGPASGRFQYLRAADVLAGDVDWNLFRDRIVLIGSTAPGLAAFRATATDPAFPDIEIHAALIAGALDGHLQRRPAGAAAIGSVVTAGIGLALALALPAMGTWGALGATLVAALVWLGSQALLWSNHGLVLPVTATLAAILLLGLFNAVAGWFAEERARRTMLARFGDYVSPHLVERMARDPLQWNSVESSHRELSILFADVRGFTRIAETVQPEILRDYLTSFLTAMTEVIHSHHGTVDKYMGDAIMAFWGAPVDDPAHADHAVAAALAMQREVARLSASFTARGLPPLAVGIGINTGIVRVGNMGSLLRRTYTVIGDAVNLASRMESLTRRHEVPIIVGEATARQCRLQHFRELGRTEIAGRSETVRIFMPLAEGDRRDSDRQDESRQGSGNPTDGHAGRQVPSAASGMTGTAATSAPSAMSGYVTDQSPARRQRTGRLHEGTGSGL